MNPGTVLGQSVALSVSLVLLALLDRPALAVLIAAVGLLWVLGLDHSYARRLATGGRTARRAKGDRVIALQLLVSYIAPAAFAVTLLVTGLAVTPSLGPVRSSDIQGVIAVVAAMLLFWLGSSHADWYYIRPRIDGVVMKPPCQTSRDSMWKGVTRKWYIHRAAASLATMLAIVLVVLIICNALAREWASALADLGGFAAIVGAGFWLMGDEVKNADATRHSIRSPRYWLGDDLAYETDMWRRRGFVLHVAIPVTKLVPLDFAGGARKVGEEPVEESSTLLRQARCQSRRFPACRSFEECKALNRECVHFDDKDLPARRRLFIF